MRYAITAGMATSIPPAVVISACDTPAASMVGSCIAPSVMAKKDEIIPSTVPKRPNNGAIAPMVPSILICFSNWWMVILARFSICMVIESIPCWRFMSPAARISPKGELSLTFSSDSRSISPCSISRCINCSRRWAGVTVLTLSFIARSMMIINIKIEHRTMGHINQPPALTNSHIRYTAFACQ